MVEITNTKKLFAKVSRGLIFTMTLFFAVGMITSCGDDDDPGTGGTGGGGGDADPSTVVASFTSQVDADNSLTYNFTNNSVVNGIDNRTFTSAWNFGGDGSSTEESPTHTFSAEGTYEVTLTVTATDGVEESTSETIEVTAPKNRYAVITDTSGDDTGELRLAVDSIANGMLSFMYRVAAGPSDDIQDGFVNVTGSSTSGRNSIVEIRLKDDTNHAFREGTSDDTDAEAVFPEGMANVWSSVQISWTSDGVNTPTFTVVIDGQTIVTDAQSTTRDPNDADQVAEHLGTVIDGARNFQWKYASNSTISDGFYHVDDIVVYSLDSGEAVAVFEDNFQGRVAGDSLHPGDEGATPYHSNSADASVGEDD